MSDGKNYLLKLRSEKYPLGNNEIQFNREQGFLEAVINEGGFVMRLKEGKGASTLEPFQELPTPSGLAFFWFHYLAAVEEMHREHGQLHLDFHERNVIMEPNGHWQTIDFGFSVRLSKYFGPGKESIKLAHPDWTEAQVLERVYELATAADLGLYDILGKFMEKANSLKKKLLKNTGKDEWLDPTTPMVARVFKDASAIKHKDYLHMYGFHEDQTDLQKLDMIIAVAFAFSADYFLISDHNTRAEYISPNGSRELPPGIDVLKAWNCSDHDTYMKCVVPVADALLVNGGDNEEVSTPLPSSGASTSATPPGQAQGKAPQVSLWLLSLSWTSVRVVTYLLLAIVLLATLCFKKYVQKKMSLKSQRPRYIL